MAASIVLGPGEQHTFHIEELTGTNQPGAFLEVPKFKVDREDLLEIHDYDKCNGKWVTVEGKRGAKNPTNGAPGELATLIVYLDQKPGPGHVPISQSEEIYVKAMPLASQLIIRQSPVD